MLRFFIKFFAMVNFVFYIADVNDPPSDAGDIFISILIPVLLSALIGFFAGNIIFWTIGGLAFGILLQFVSTSPDDGPHMS